MAPKNPPLPAPVLPKQYHWCVKRHQIQDVDILERALAMYDSLGWEIFDVDISGGWAVVVMRASRESGQLRPQEKGEPAVPEVAE